jgi:hypothetical protein
MSFAESHLNWLIRQCTPQAGPGGTTISFSILWAGKIFFWPVRPQAFLLGPEGSGGGILRFNFSKLPTTAGAYR